MAKFATEGERQGYASAALAGDGAAMEAVIKSIKRRNKPKTDRKPSTKRIDTATSKLIVRYGKQQVIDSIGRWVPPEDRPTVSAGDTAQTG